MIYYLFFFIFGFGLVWLLAPVFIGFVKRINLLDVPNMERKIHAQPMPLAGGYIIFTTLLIGTLLYFYFFKFGSDLLTLKSVSVILISSFILLLGGLIDDKFNLRAKYQIFFPIIACALAVGFGVGDTFKRVSNPFGEPIDISVSFLSISLGSAFSFVWLMGTTYTIKFLDGLDGLAAGISAIGFFVLFLLSNTDKINQPGLAVLSILLVGGLVGYLFYAFHPAKVFLGEGGSTFLGFLLGAFSIILGGKIATALLVMGVPVFDAAWVIFRRIRSGQSPFRGDKLHLHHRLLDYGISHRASVLLLYGVSFFFGLLSIAFQTTGKIILLMLLFGLMAGFVLFVDRRKAKKYNNPD